MAGVGRNYQDFENYPIMREKGKNYNNLYHQTGFVNSYILYTKTGKKLYCSVDCLTENITENYH
jgi:hypothetical protein